MKKNPEAAVHMQMLRRLRQAVLTECNCLASRYNKLEAIRIATDEEAAEEHDLVKLLVDTQTVERSLVELMRILRYQLLNNPLVDAEDQTEDDFETTEAWYMEARKLSQFIEEEWEGPDSLKAFHQFVFNVSVGWRMHDAEQDQ